MFERNEKAISLSSSGSAGNFIRPRINKLLAKVIEKPLVVVCAGTGYGKTCAVSGFIKESGTSAAWIQCSDSDNVSFHFWENFLHSISLTNNSLAAEFRKIGFPDNADKITGYSLACKRYFLALP